MKILIAILRFFGVEVITAEEKEAPLDPKKYEGFSIEFLPDQGRYYPMAGSNYIQRDTLLGHYSTGPYRDFAQYASSKKGARKIIDKYLHYRADNAQKLPVTE